MMQEKEIIRKARKAQTKESDAYQGKLGHVQHSESSNMVPINLDNLDEMLNSSKFWTCPNSRNCRKTLDIVWKQCNHNETPHKAERATVQHLASEPDSFYT